MNEFKHSYDTEHQTLSVSHGGKTTVFKKGCLVRVYRTFFAKRPPHDVDFGMFSDVLVTKVESMMHYSDYCIRFEGVDVNCNNPATSSRSFSISRECTAMRYLKLLKNNQLELRLWQE